ncbi:MAG: transporter substrate-binding domain-containing protein [Gammaproteobacteria bacterium]|nr:transporter substrate-binding domain-containing protein [Gammaproteobacteria bacterium]
MKKFLAFILLAVSSFLLVSCGGASDGLAKEGVLVVGMECDYAPFNWTETEASDTNVPIENIKGAYAEGYDVQVARIIAKELNLELKIKALAWDGLIQSLNSNEIDLIIAGMSPTEERKQTIDFSSSYYRSTHVLLLRSDSTYANATTLSGFSGATVIGQIGTLYADLAAQLSTNYGAKQGTNLDTVSQIVNAILRKTADITVLEEPVAMGIVSQYGTDLTYIKTTDSFEVSDEDVVVSIGVRKGFSYLDEINAVLSNILTELKRYELMVNAINQAPKE